ncbi:type IVB secretion system coupling complex protein DotM/IcmP [Candidatus Comchoanobacter bicostacola]|uniref:Type IVB secretion system coupling complex protein DotM/IcmP n=1 Tax=Candidatus Comchoanobacter bicostacola TaxID=2919598 RepID=A0ABY5DIE9_9GAMM|nr:type IVB secretion system coupling complex protein DotM/IcmP [Candidatus Comchoanobacter bicostacola]UTC24406.1 type IVB secretion system coupling complex protein DotM/IcmP [Candidatus Comchoanobacter bicostacola]
MKGGGGQQQTPDQAQDFFLLVAFFVGLVIVVWYAYSEYVVRYVFTVRLLVGKALFYFLEGVDSVLDHIDPDLLSTNDLSAALRLMESSSPSLVDLDLFLSISTVYGKAFALPNIMLAIAGVVYVMFFHRYSKYSQAHSMVSLARQELKNWPQSACVVGLDLISENVKEGNWRMSERPLDFAKRYKLIIPERTKNITVARLDKDKARPVFAAQMGPLWEGLEGVPPYVLALFAIFAARGAGDPDGARKLIRQIARSAGKGALDFTGTRLLLAKHIRSEKIGPAVGPHAYLYTAMASMLELARDEGVLSMCEFLWLKPVDRSLWYMLSNVGRPTAFVEVSAPFSHWLVEKRLRRPLKVPIIEPAIEALDKELANIIINPEDIDNG